MLPLYGEINRELEAADTLVVLARGLGMACVLSRFVAPRVSSKRLILALNIKKETAVQVIWPALRSVSRKFPPEDSSLLLPRYLNSDYSVSDRKSVYGTGGFVIASDNILVHDLLCRNLPVEDVDGIIVFAADRVQENSNTHFALTLFRRRNKLAFIKAVSENAALLTAGFHRVEKLMRTLFVCRLSNWPRFHKSVKDAFAQRTPDIVDLSIPLSQSQGAVASALRDIAIILLDDLLLASRSLDLSDVYRKLATETTDRKRLLVSNFDDVVRRQLAIAPGQRKISGGEKVRSLVADLSSVRSLLDSSVDLNSVLFYQRLVTIRNAHDRASYWLMRRESQTMLRIARARVFARRRINEVVAPASRPGHLETEARQGDLREKDFSLAGGAGDDTTVLVPVLDHSPKWEVLSSVLSEIESDVREVDETVPGADVGRVLIVVRDQVTSDELRHVLTSGPDLYMRRLFQAVLPASANSIAWKEVSSKSVVSDGMAEQSGEQTTISQYFDSKVPGTRAGVLGNSSLPPGSESHLVPVADQDKRPGKRLRATEKDISSKKLAGEMGVSNAPLDPSCCADGSQLWPWPVRLDRIEQREGCLDGLTEPEAATCSGRVLPGIRNFFGCATASNPAKPMEVLLWCLEWVDSQGRGKVLLDQFRPSFVIMYHADVAFIRQVEVFRAESRRHAVRLYLLSYEDRVDEDRYRNVIERERSAFKMLIRERAGMVIHANQEGRFEEPQDNGDNPKASCDFSGSLTGGRALGADKDSRFVAVPSETDTATSKVVVDTRELRSSLPMHLHNSGIEIFPITLEVGDFILSNSIAIERKSVSDLYGSFDSGRLSKQASALCRHYKYACLLVELDHGSKLSLASTSGGVAPNLSPASILSKMVLLIREFPSLRLLWAVGQVEAAELFAALKVNEDEPKPDVAAALGVDSGESDDSEFNSAPAALLRSLPGIDGHNIGSVMRKVRNVGSLLNMSKKDMAQVLGNEGKARKLYEFANEQPGEGLAAL